MTYCRSSGQNEFAFMGVPLNLPNAFGSLLAEDSSHAAFLLWETCS